MDATAINEAIKLCLCEACSKLGEATRIARAAEARALAGSVTEGVSKSPWISSNSCMKLGACTMPFL